MDFCRNEPVVLIQIEINIIDQTTAGYMAYCVRN